MDRNKNRVTGPDVQGQRDRDKEDGDGYGYGHRQDQGQDDSARCMGTNVYGQGRVR